VIIGTRSDSGERKQKPDGQAAQNDKHTVGPSTSAGAAGAGTGADGGGGSGSGGAGGSGANAAKQSLIPRPKQMTKLPPKRLDFSRYVITVVVVVVVVVVDDVVYNHVIYSADEADAKQLTTQQQQQQTTLPTKTSTTATTASSNHELARYLPHKMQEVPPHLKYRLQQQSHQQSQQQQQQEQQQAKLSQQQQQPSKQHNLASNVDALFAEVCGASGLVTDLDDAITDGDMWRHVDSAVFRNYDEDSVIPALSADSSFFTEYPCEQVLRVWG